MKQHTPAKELSLDDIFTSDVNPAPKYIPCGRKIRIYHKTSAKKNQHMLNKINNHKSISTVISFKESLEKVRKLISVIE